MPLHGPGVVSKLARTYNVKWLTAWHWLNREKGLCANGCGPSERYLCPACSKRHCDNRRANKLRPRAQPDENRHHEPSDQHPE